MAAVPDRGLFHPAHPRRLIPELSAYFHGKGWFVGTGSGGFISIKQGDSIYVAPSNVVKNRIEGDDLFVYKVSDSSVTLSPSQDRELSPCEIIGSILLVFQERQGARAVLHSNGKEPCLASLVCTQNEFRIKNQAVIRGIYNDGLKRYYNMDEELLVPIINHATEAEMRQALKEYPHTHAVIVRNQGIFVWGDTWQKCQSMSESYHFLMDISLQMEKLRLTGYTPATTANDVVLNDSSKSSSVPENFEESPISKPPVSVPSPSVKRTTSPSTVSDTQSPAKSASATTNGKQANAKTPSTVSDTQSPAKSSSETTNGKQAIAKTPSTVSDTQSPATSSSATTNGKHANAKTSPLRKLFDGKVTKSGVTTGSRGSRSGVRHQFHRGHGRDAAPFRPNGSGFNPNGHRSMGPLMGPGPMCPPMGPPMGMMGPPTMGPMMRGPNPMLGGYSPVNMGRGGHALHDRRGKGGKKWNKAGVTKNFLMNY